MDWLLEQALTGFTPSLGTPEQRALQSIFGEPRERIRLSPRGVQVVYPDLSGGGRGRLANPLNRFLSSAQYGSPKQTGWEEFLAGGKQGRNFIAANNATLANYLEANPQYQGLFDPGTPQYQDFQRRLYGAMSTGAAIRNLAEVTGAPFSQPLGVRPFPGTGPTRGASPFSPERNLYLQGGGNIFQNPQDYFKYTQIAPAQNGEYQITRRDGREIFFNPVFGYVRQGGNYARTLSPEGMELLQSFGIQPGETIQNFAKALNEGGTISTRDIGDLARQGDAFTLAPLTQMQLAAAREQFNADLDQEGAQFIDGQRIFNTSNVNLYRGKEALRPMAEAIVRLAEQRRRAEPGRNLPPLTEEQAFQVAAQLIHSTYGIEDGIPAQNRIKSLRGLNRVSHDVFEALQDYGNELQFTNAVLQEMKAPSIHPRSLGQIASSQAQPILADRPGPLIDYKELKHAGELSPEDTGRLKTEVTRAVNAVPYISAYSEGHNPPIGNEKDLGPATLRKLVNEGAGTLSPALERLFPENFNRSTKDPSERLLEALRYPTPDYFPTVNWWGKPFTNFLGDEVGEPARTILRYEPMAPGDYRLAGQEVYADTGFNEEQKELASFYRGDPYAAIQESAGGNEDIYALVNEQAEQALSGIYRKDPYDPTSGLPVNPIRFDAASLDPAQINPVLTTRRRGDKIIEGPHTPLPLWMIADRVTGTTAGRQALFNPANQPSLFNDPGLIANFTDYRNFFNPQRPSSRLGPAEFVPNYWEPPSSRSIRQMQNDWFNAPQWEDRSDDVVDPEYLRLSNRIDQRVLADRELAARLQANDDQVFAEAQRERAFYDAQNANPGLLYNPSFQQLTKSNPEAAIAALERAWPGGSHLVGLNPNYNEAEALKAARALTVGNYGIQNMPGGLNLTDEEKALAKLDGSHLQDLIGNPYFELPSEQPEMIKSRFETIKGDPVDPSKRYWLLRDLQNQIANTPGANLPWLLKNEGDWRNQQNFQELGTTRMFMPENKGVLVRISRTPAVEPVYSQAEILRGENQERPKLPWNELLNQEWLFGADEVRYRSLQPINPGLLHRLDSKDARKLHARELQAIQGVAKARGALRNQLVADNAVLVNGSLRLPWQKLDQINEAVKAAIPMPFSMGPQEKVPPAPNASIPSLGIPYSQRYQQSWEGEPIWLTETPYVSPMAKDYTIPSQSATPLKYAPQYEAANEANQEWLNLLAQPQEGMTTFNLGTPPGDPEYLPVFRHGESGSLNIDRSVPQIEFTNTGFSTAGNRLIPAPIPDWDRVMLPLNLEGQSSPVMPTTGQAMQPSLLTPQAQAYPLSLGSQTRATFGNPNFDRLDTYTIDKSNPLDFIDNLNARLGRLNAIMEAGETQRKPMASQQNQQNTPVVQVPREIITQPASGQVIQYATPKNPRQIQLPMNYGYQGMARPEVTQYLQQTGRPLTTMGAVDAGLRTGTTRGSLPPGLAVGDLILITGGGLPAVQAQVDAILNQGEFNPATRAWSIREGWQPSPGGKIGEQVFSPNAKQVIWTPVDRPTIVRGINSPVDYAKAQVYGNQNIALGFTANSMRNQNGALVMGAGNAQQAALANPSAPIRFGAALRDQGTPIGGDFGLIENPGSNFVAIQTKRDWRQPTPMDLLENVTLPAVQQWSRNNPGQLLITPPWGIGQGGANPDQVAQLMSRLPANVMIADPGNTPAFRRNPRFLFM